MHLLQHQFDGYEIFLFRSSLQGELLPMGYIGDPGKLALTGWLNYLRYLSWVPKIRLCKYQPFSFLCVSSYTCYCSMCSLVQITVSLFHLSASHSVPRVAETWALAVESNGENHNMSCNSQLEAGLGCPVFTLLALEPAGLNLAQLCSNMSPSYLQLQHRWSITAVHEYHGSAMGCKQIWPHPEAATIW